MPSVRIRDSAYSLLADSPVVSQRQRLATTPPTNNLNVPTSPKPLLPRMRTMPALRNQDPGSTGSTSPPLRPQRPRSGTTSSRVHDHCIRSAARYSLAFASQDCHNTASGSIAALPLLTPSQEDRDNFQGALSVTAATVASRSSYQNTHTDSIREEDASEVHHDDVIEHLDVIDPQVATISSLTDAANTILIPPLSWYSRKPLVELSSLESVSVESDPEAGVHRDSYTNPLDRHVDNVLKRPSRLRRTMRGVWSFLKTPMGIITAIYGFLVVFWGAAIVLFLTKIINLHNEDKQGLWVEISSQVVNALFTVTGVGLIPSRVLDTYRIYWIWHYKRKTRRLRAVAGMPPLVDVDDLPDPAIDPNYQHVLTEREQKHLHRQQTKFQHSQTWYRPHGTETHRAFPINIALLICLFSDGNSIFQVMLCGTMWGLNRFRRPAWTTATLITFSFLCGILAVIFIWRGGRATRRVGHVEKRLRAALDGADNQEPQDILDGFAPLNGEKNPEASEPIVEEIMLVPPAKQKGHQLRSSIPSFSRI